VAAGPSTTDSATHPSPYLAYQPALDGVRGIAIAVVIAYHLPSSSFRGGFLGVEIFFVLSGFLITTLLVREWDRTRTIALGHFYARRALRLLPALAVVLIAAQVWAGVTSDHGQAHNIYNDSWTTLFYVQNWFNHNSFAEVSVLSHAWSLAVEEQFYLVWPVMLLGLLHFRWSRVATVTTIGLTACALAAYRLVLWQSGVSYLRLYFGSDTRADALLFGAAAGALVAWRLLPGGKGWTVLLHWLAAGSVLVMVVMIATNRVESGSLYDGGFAVFSVSVAIVLIDLTRSPRTWMARGLGCTPMRWAGRLSYSLYLWHWPVIIVLNSGRMGLSTWPTRAVDLSVTLALALASYHLVERPFLRMKRRWEPAAGPVAQGRREAIAGVDS
jgi:peptidoglycan/LPS O-acetylase OafA/YrhL